MVFLRQDITLKVTSKRLSWDALGKAIIEMSLSDDQGSLAHLASLHTCLLSRVAIFSRKAQRLDFDVSSMRLSVPLRRYLSDEFSEDDLDATLLDAQNKPTLFFKVLPIELDSPVKDLPGEV